MFSFENPQQCSWQQGQSCCTTLNVIYFLYDALNYTERWLQWNRHKYHKIDPILVSFTAVKSHLLIAHCVFILVFSGTSMKIHVLLAMMKKVKNKTKNNPQQTPLRTSSSSTNIFSPSKPDLINIHNASLGRTETLFILQNKFQMKVLQTYKHISMNNNTQFLSSGAQRSSRSFGKETKRDKNRVHKQAPHQKDPSAVQLWKRALTWRHTECAVDTDL